MFGSGQKGHRMKTIDWIMLGFKVLGGCLSEILAALQTHKETAVVAKDK